MRIVDGQVHLNAIGHSQWQEVPPEGLDLAERRRRGPDFHWRPDVDDLTGVMDTAGVASTLLVPIFVDGRPDHGPSLDAAEQHPQRFAVLGRIPSDRAAAISSLNDWTAIPEILGLRITFSKAMGNTEEFREGRLDWLWRELESLNLPVSILAPGMLADIGHVAERYPALRIVCDHLGFASEQIEDDLRPFIKPILDLARFHNVAVKASALPCFTTEEYPFPRLKDLIHRVIDAFGSERVFWGSDLSHLPCRLETLVRFFREDLDFLSEGESEDVLGRGLVRWMGWKALESLV